MSPRRFPRWGLLLSATVLLACGQKPGVYVESGGPMAVDGGDTPSASATLSDELEVAPGGGTDGGLLGGFDEGGGSSAADAGDVSDVDDGSTGGSGAQGSAGRAAGSRSGGGAGGEAGGGRSGADGGGADARRREVRGQDRTGVADDALTVAIHAPITGAAPLPSQVFEQTRDLYWRWVTEVREERILGRDRVEVLFADDRFEPTVARQVCRELASEAFLLIGGAGADGIGACGQLAGQIRVPYFSAGVTEAGLRDNPWYFAMSMSYAQQGDLGAQMLNELYPGKRNASVVMGSRSADDGLEAFEAAARKHGIDYYRSLRTPSGQGNWYSSFARELADAGVEVINIAVPPLDYIRFAQVAEEQGLDFHYVGVGPTMGINGVLRSGCPSTANGTFLSPIPSMDLVDDMAPDFRRAARHFGLDVDDSALALWAINAALHDLLDQYGQAYGDDLTREDFRDFVSSGTRVETGLLPPVEITPDDHFGGRSMHVLRADCDRQVYADGGTFVDSF